MTVIGTNTKAKSDDSLMSSLALFKSQWGVSAARTSTCEVPLFVSDKFNSIKRAATRCTHVYDVFIVLEVESLGNEFTAGTLASQSCVLVLGALVVLLVVNLIALDDDCAVSVIEGLPEGQVMHLRDLIMVMVLGDQGAIQVICQVSVLIGWA
jgi:hypothetical protein